MSETKLDAGQRHVLKLIARDKKPDGWTTVSAVLYPTLSKDTPTELAEFEPIGDAGRARLTPSGQGIVDAMEWL